MGMSKVEIEGKADIEVDTMLLTRELFSILFSTLTSFSPSFLVLAFHKECVLLHD